MYLITGSDSANILSLNGGVSLLHILTFSRCLRDRYDIRSFYYMDFMESTANRKLVLYGPLNDRFPEPEWQGAFSRTGTS